jgi:ribosomal protein L11 methyltransferase
MNYIQIEFFIEGDDRNEKAEILMALLSEHPFDSFEETDPGLTGFLPEHLFDEQEFSTALAQLPENIKFKHLITRIKDQNWNKKWESNYDPVLIDGQCHIRAPFHQALTGVPYEIVIEPKMSFGTAHHETTSMMISYILENQWENLSVLDMGCGTGVLAILASMKGSRSVLAIDNDEWAYTNTRENLEKNNIKNIRVLAGGKESIPDQKFDTILANINRNILLDQMETYCKVLTPNGKLFMSGFYQEDIPVIEREAGRLGLQYVSKKTKNDWTAIQMEFPGNHAKPRT